MPTINKVLVVDDSELIHTMLKLVLRKYKGCTIIDAMNGLEALDIVSKETGFDLILLDIKMPIMDGLQLMEKIKEKNLCRNIPIIVISIDSREEDMRKALELGASDYVVKPFKSHELHEKISKAFERN